MLETHQENLDFTVSLPSVQDKFINKSDKGLPRGEWPGFASLAEYMTLKKGTTSYIYAAPHQGKSQFAIELLVNLMEFSNWKIAIYSPETGEAEDVYMEYAHAYLKKPVFKDQEGCATDAEIKKAMQFLSNRLFVIDSGDEDMTLGRFWHSVELIEEKHGIKLDCAVIDPFTDIVATGDFARDDQFLNVGLTRVRNKAKTMNIHVMVIAHTKVIENKTAKVKDGEDMDGKPIYKEVTYQPMALPNQLAGGQMWWRKGMLMVNVWRPPSELIDSDWGQPFEPNQTRITVVKAKPKGVAKLGYCDLYFDAERNRYYEAPRDENGRADGAKGSYSYRNPDADVLTQKQIDI